MLDTSNIDIIIHNTLPASILLSSEMQKVAFLTFVTLVIG